MCPFGCLLGLCLIVGLVGLVFVLVVVLVCNCFVLGRCVFL